MHPPLVTIEHIDKSFGGNRVLTDVSLDIRPGTVHCLIGENGAGKSTLGKILAGVHRPDSGRLIVDGSEASFRSPAEALRHGIAGMAQEVALVPAMSVADNVLLGHASRKPFVSRRAQNRAVAELLRTHGFALDPRTIVSDLAIADQQKVEILKALARGSKLIVMDEPTASLGDADARALLDVVRMLREAGTTVVYISHHLAEVVAIADHVTVLRDGAVVYDGTPLSRPELVAQMLGRSLEAAFPPKQMVGVDSPAVLELIGVSAPTVARDISLTVREGEIVGIAGLVGSGRTELARVIAGVDQPTSGSMRLSGRPLRPRSPRDAMRQGVHLIPENRKTQGLVLVRPIRENTSYSVLDRIASAGILKPRRERTLVADAASRTDIRTSSLESAVWTLSGGNQQKVMFARASLARPRVLVIDEPTKGVDVGAKFSIHQLITELAALGIAIIVISSEHEEVMGLAHRVVVMREGAIVAEFDGPEFDADRVTRTVVDTASDSPASTPEAEPEYR